MVEKQRARYTGQIIASHRTETERKQRVCKVKLTEERQSGNEKKKKRSENEMQHSLRKRTAV